MNPIEIPRSANRATGPRTDAGKARSSQNAIKHGLTSRTIVLANEDPAAWHRLLDSYLERFQPADPVEAHLLEQLAAAQWRIRRAWAIESATYDLEIAASDSYVRENFDQIDQPTRTAIAHRNLTDQSRSLASIQRYEARLSREYHRALSELRALQQERRSREVPEHQSAAEPPAPDKQKLQNELPPTGTEGAIPSAPQRDFQCPPGASSGTEPASAGEHYKEPGTKGEHERVS
jgi:hypothetical protein